jgi:hypothetical protein
VIRVQGKIALDSEFGKQLGFTSDKFDGWLWKRGNYIYISFIVSKKEGCGNLSRLFRQIEKAGFGIKVPTPFAKMASIVKKHGFEETAEAFDNSLGCFDTIVWVKEAKKK